MTSALQTANIQDRPMPATLFTIPFLVGATTLLVGLFRILDVLDIRLFNLWYALMTYFWMQARLLPGWCLFIE